METYKITWYHGKYNFFTKNRGYAELLAYKKSFYYDDVKIRVIINSKKVAV